MIKRAEKLIHSFNISLCPAVAAMITGQQQFVNVWHLPNVVMRHIAVQKYHRIFVIPTGLARRPAVQQGSGFSDSLGGFFRDFGFWAHYK